MAKTAWIASLLALFALCGCSFLDREPYHKTSYFEIVPAKDGMHPEAACSMLSVSSSFQFSDRMLFRVAADRLEFDEYSRWIASPEVLLKRYLEISFAPVDPAKVAASVKILSFEFDKPGKSASCEIILTLSRDNMPIYSARIGATAKAKDETATGFVEAMHAAVAEITAKVAAELKKSNG